MQQWVQGLQAFIFCVVAVNDEHTKPRFKSKALGVKFKDGICAEICLKLWFESDWYFCNTTESGRFWKWLSRKKILFNHFLKSLWKSSCPKAHCGTLNSYFQSNDKYHLSLTRFDQISDPKHSILEWKAIH